MGYEHPEHKERRTYEVAIVYRVTVYDGVPTTLDLLDAAYKAQVGDLTGVTEGPAELRYFAEEYTAKFELVENITTEPMGD